LGFPYRGSNVITNHRKVCVGRYHEDHPDLTALLWAGLPPTTSGCPGPHPTWPGELAGMGHSLLFCMVTQHNLVYRCVSTQWLGKKSQAWDRMCFPEEAVQSNVCWDVAYSSETDFSTSLESSFPSLTIFKEHEEYCVWCSVDSH